VHALEDLLLPLRFEIGLGRTSFTGCGAGEVVDEVWIGSEEALCRIRGERSNSWSIVAAIKSLWFKDGN